MPGREIYTATRGLLLANVCIFLLHSRQIPEVVFEDFLIIICLFARVCFFKI